MNQQLSVEEFENACKLYDLKVLPWSAFIGSNSVGNATNVFRTVCNIYCYILYVVIMNNYPCQPQIENDNNNSRDIIQIQNKPIIPNVKSPVCLLILTIFPNYFNIFFVV